VGLIAITVYLVLERSLTAHLPALTCLMQLLQWDASNAYGPAAFRGGWTMALIGLGMDLVASQFWAVVFTAIYVSTPIVRRHVVVSGLCFGAVVMVVMIFGAVPIGHAAEMRMTPQNLLNVFIAHAVFFGLPLALTVRKVLA
jgi:hypothetical protein